MKGRIDAGRLRAGLHRRGYAVRWGIAHSDTQGLVVRPEVPGRRRVRPPRAGTLPRHGIGRNSGKYFGVAPRSTGASSDKQGRRRGPSVDHFRITNTVDTGHGHRGVSETETIRAFYPVCAYPGSGRGRYAANSVPFQRSSREADHSMGDVGRQQSDTRSDVRRFPHLRRGCPCIRTVRASCR